MRIGTYNVLGLSGYPPNEGSLALGSPSSEVTAKHFTKVFGSLDCDILALQEGVTLTQIQRITTAMGMQVATFPSPLAWSGHIITRFPIIESRIYSHPKPDAAKYPFSRAAGAVLLSLDEDHSLWIVNLHLHPASIQMRNVESEFISRHIDQLLETQDPVVVLGDLNSQVEEAIHSMLESKEFTNVMLKAGGGIQPTFNTVGLNGRWAIDHIYISGHLADYLTDAEVIRSEGFRHDGPQKPGLWVHSDHLPVVATLDYPR